MEGPIHLHLFLLNLDFRDKVRNVLHDLVELSGGLPLALHHIIKQISPIAQGRIREGSAAKDLGLLEGELVVEQDVEHVLLNLRVQQLRLNHSLVNCELQIN